MKQLSLEAYVKRPIGGWTSGQGWLHFCTEEPHLVGGVTWGAFGAEAADALLACATATLDAVPPHPGLVDARRISTIDAVAFEIASDFVRRTWERLGKTMQKLVAVRPPGLAGALASGFFNVVPAPYPVEIFEERGEALRAIGLERYVDLVAELEQLASGGALGFVVDLRRAIEDDLVGSTIATSAKKLGMSVRSLQRRLQSEGTSFQRELTVVRIEAARRLMMETDLSITRIATQVGFASPAVFSTVFRRHEGVTPSDWREANGQKPST